MPISSCPECDMPMQVTHYEDVLIDVCPSCRGVWLDRGELQKIIAIVRAEESGDIAEELSRRPAKPRPELAERRDERDRDRDDDQKSKKKRKKSWRLWDAIEELID